MTLSRQFLPFFAISLLLASALVFVPASAASSLSVVVDADHNEYSFASVNGTASFALTITNDGDTDFNEVMIDVSFDDESWEENNVTFTFSDSSFTGGINLGTLASGAIAQVSVDALVGYGVMIDGSKSVHMNLKVIADSTEFSVPDTIIVVSNWKAYQSEFPASPDSKIYDIGDNNTYQILVENIAVEMLPDGSTQPVDISDEITVTFGGLMGWTITSDDPNWEMNSGVINQLSAGQTYTWDIKVQLNSMVAAGNSVLDLQASSLDPDSPFGFPYYQPFGMLSIPVSAAEIYGVKLDGGGSREVDLSTGSAVAEWAIRVNNLGNADDEYTITWNLQGVPADWSINVDSLEPVVTDTVSMKDYYEFNVVLNVPSDSLSGSVAAFSMNASSNGDTAKTASQEFTATVNQHYGVALSVDSQSKESKPGQTVDFIFNLTNTGNGQDTYGLSVAGPAVWNPTLSQDSSTVGAISISQFTLTVTIPSDRDAGVTSPDIVVTALSSDGLTTANSTVSVITSQVYDIQLGYVSGSNGTAKVTQETTIVLRLNVTNNGNGIDTLNLTMTNAPSWASLGADSIQIGRGQTQAITITLSPDAAALSGRDYTFQVVVTSADGTEYISPDFSAKIDVKETSASGGGEVQVEEIDSEEESSLPGFGFIASLFALSSLVALRRRA